MRVLVDESTGAAVVINLRAHGHDVFAVAESMPQASDSAILMQAASDRRLVITNDKDFGELAFRSGQAHAGVLLLRLRDERAESRVAMVTSVLDRWGDRLLGAFTVATERGVRIRAIDQLP